MVMQVRSSTNRPHWNITSSLNSEKAPPTIDITGKTLNEICFMINISDANCTCERSTIFRCNRFWDKVEASVKITAPAIAVLGNMLVLIITIKEWDYSKRFRNLIRCLALGH